VQCVQSFFRMLRIVLDGKRGVEWSFRIFNLGRVLFEHGMNYCDKADATE
jgi:hypothetical protein